MKKIINRINQMFVCFKKTKIDCYVIEYPKCGRTWIRIMLMKAFASNYGKDVDEVLANPSSFSFLPKINYTHDGTGISLTQETLTFENLEPDKSRYLKEKVVFVVRDPRDVLVSFYFQATKRQKVFSGNISEFIRDERFGMKKIMVFYDHWCKASKKKSNNFLLIRYEDLHKITEQKMMDICKFLNFEIPMSHITEAVQYASFENMKKMEGAGEIKTSKVLQAGNVEDKESFKVRRGKVGGYIDYLSDSDIAYVNEQMNAYKNDFVLPYIKE